MAGNYYCIFCHYFCLFRNNYEPQAIVFTNRCFEKTTTSKLYIQKLESGIFSRICGN